VNVEAYKVSVRIALEDQITRGMAAMGTDILNLDEKVKVLAQSLKSVTSAAKEAQKAIKNVAAGAGSQFTSAKKGADDYANSLREIESRARSVEKFQTNSPPRLGLSPALMGSAILVSNNVAAEK
jgi:hypothetical protein